MKRGWVLAIGGAIALALVGAWIAGLGSDPDEQPAPFTVSEREVRDECLTATYVPEAAGFELAERPPPRDWREVEGAKRAMTAERNAVEVAIRPKEGTPTITLTDVHFDVVNHPLRPVGSVFYRPCRKQLVGAAIEADLDGGVEIVSSSADPEGTLGVGLRLPRSGPPIRFPWTLSLRRPLRLYLVVNTQGTYSDWSARIPWTAGSSEGVIRVDNGGRKYRIVDGVGTGWYKPGRGDQWVDSGSSRWIGVR
jgi:hypothetical protein